MEKIDMREAMVAKGYSMKNYAVSRGLDYDLLRQVVTGVRIGRRRGKSRECVRALYLDGVLPSTHPAYESVVLEVARQKEAMGSG